jgi:uncharacterized membrane protein (DUF373 family)
METTERGDAGRGHDAHEADDAHHVRRRRQASRLHERGDEILSWAEDAIYAVVALILVAGAVVLVVDAVVTFVEHADEGMIPAATELLSVLLLVFVFVELLAAVRLTLRERQLLAEPFLLVGIIASIKEIVVVAGAERPADDGFEAFRNGMVEIGVLSGVVLVLAIAALLLRRRQREPVQPPEEPTST